MMNIDEQNKFRNEYRIPSARATWNDYTVGAYFITICTKGRRHCFGEIANGKIQLSEIGMVAEKCWLDIPMHFPHADAPLMVVMPNHVHGIVVIHNVETQNFASPQPQQNKFGLQSRNLASIVRGYKIGVTKHARLNNIPFAWQPRFHDHLIRNREEMNRIAEYIECNVARWDLDELNNKNLTTCR